MKKKVLVFGSTGSIGTSALRIIEKHPRAFEVAGLAVRGDVDGLRRQIELFQPRFAAVYDEQNAAALKKGAGQRTRLSAGKKAVMDLADVPADIAVVGVSGVDAIPLICRLVKSVKRIVLANKECLVVAGRFIMPLIRKSGVEFFPADSEMFALALLLENVVPAAVSSVGITASGGALRDFSKAERDAATVQEVLRHPTWRMGRKITVDSATMVNKAFEVVEASWIFEREVSSIDVFLHKESLIHATVSLKNHVSYACMFTPDMRIPLAYGLCYPDTAALEGKISASLPPQGTMSWTRLKKGMYPCFDLVTQYAAKSRDALVRINAANDVVVESFLKGLLRFKDVYQIVKKVARHFPGRVYRTLDDVMEDDREVRGYTRKVVQNIYA